MNARAGFARIATLAASLVFAAGMAHAAAATSGGGRIVTAAAGRCGVCHPAERVAFETSPHSHEEVHCVSCHGGDDTTTDEKRAHGAGFKGRIDRTDIPKVCARCHADEKVMRPYGLPVDQYNLYMQSRHGQLLAKGDRKVAVCSDCHGAHDIMAVSDPASRVFATNIPRTCGKCHGDAEMLKERKIKNAYADYLSSAHAHELLDLGNMRAPTCVSCHGVHGAQPPDVGDVTKVCGRCHTAERRYFTAGPHAKKMAENNVPACIACHGNHAVQASVAARLATNCGSCHEKGDANEAMGGKILADYTSAKAEIELAEKSIADADAVPMQTEDYHARVEEARTYLREAMTAAHAVQPEQVAAFTARARSVGSEIRSEIKHKFDNMLMGKLGLVVFWFYVLMTVGILRRYRNKLAKDR